MTDWIPLSQRGDPEPYLGSLYDGIPTWLADSINEWLLSVFGFRSGGEWRYTTDSMRQAERKLRLASLGDTGFQMLRALQAYISADDPIALDIVDFALMTSSEYDDEPAQLEVILEEGGSAWSVTRRGDTWGLEERVPEAARAQAEKAMGLVGRSSRYLGEAWVRTYGRDRDPSMAYREAVRAVEAAAKPIVTPDDEMATLGKMIVAIRDAPHKWEVVLDPGGFDPVSGLLGMLEALWTAQLDRHGTDDDEAALYVSREQAEAAVHLAVTLVIWFEKGYVQRV